MRRNVTQIVALSCLPLVLALLAGCTGGISKYPGQPGLKSNVFTKIDLETIENEGLFIYEVIYDNTPNGSGVEVVATKYYPNVYTGTSNSRMNADGTLYRCKQAYQGGQVAMLSFPKQNFIYLPYDSPVTMFLEYEQSLNEIDDRNLVEEGLFQPGPEKSSASWDYFTTYLDILKAGKFDSKGGLTFSVNHLSFNDVSYAPQNPVTITSNLNLSGLTCNYSPEEKERFLGFFEKNFPAGFSGNVSVFVNEQQEPLIFKKIKLHSIKTARHAGITVSRVATDFIKGVTARLLAE